MYGQEQNSREMIIAQYEKDVNLLLQYLPWLSKKKGSDVSRMYDGDGQFKVIPLPVYDSTLLQFVRVAAKTSLMNRNYPYVYRRYHLNTPADERKAMENAKITDIELFRGILSKYVMEGQRRGPVWTLAVEERIFVTALECLDSLFHKNGNA